MYIKKSKVFFLFILTLTIISCKSIQSEPSESTSLDSKPNYQRDAGELGRCSEKERDWRGKQAAAATVLTIAGGVTFLFGWPSVAFVPLFGGVAVGGMGGGVAGIALGHDRKSLCGLEDLDFAQYAGDWSLRRIKRSCLPYYPVAGVKHVSNIEVNLGCNSNSLLKKEEAKMLQNVKMGRKGKDVFKGITLPEYRYVEPGVTNTKWGYSLDCGENEYVAGISFGVTDITYGIKSILCGRIPEGRKEKSCSYLGDNSDECPENKYMKGMYVQRGYRNGNIGGNVGQEATGRLDDRFEYGDQVKGVSCCAF